MCSLTSWTLTRAASKLKHHNNNHPTNHQNMTSLQFIMFTNYSSSSMCSRRGPQVVDLLHRSAGGVLLLSLRSWSICRLLGRPGRRFQLWLGRWPKVRSTWHRSAWRAGVSSESLAMWPKTEFQRHVMRSDTGRFQLCCDLGVPDVILPMDLGYLVLALHVESLQTSFISSEYGPCLTGVQKNR